MQHPSRIHDLFATLLAGDGIADGHSEQLQYDGLAYSPSDFLILEKPVQIIQIILMGNLPPLLT